MDVAAKMHQAGDAKGAAALYKTIAKSDPANLAAWDLAIDIACRELADVGECLGILDFELELLGKIDRHHDVLGEALEKRARARLEQGMNDAALADLERAVKAGAERPTVYTALTAVLLARGDKRGAAEALKIAIKLDPKLPEIGPLHARVEGSTVTAADAPFGGP